MRELLRTEGLAQRRDDACLGLDVDRGERVVQYQQARRIRGVGRERPRQAQALALAPEMRTPSSPIGVSMPRGNSATSVSRAASRTARAAKSG